MSEQETLLEFPCVFPIKAMGRSDSGFEARALAIVRRHVTDFKAESMKVVASQKGNYLSVTFTIEATSREQLDLLYIELNANPRTKMAL